MYQKGHQYNMLITRSKLSSLQDLFGGDIEDILNYNYTLSDLGDLSNLIGSLSRTIQQYLPPWEWIMCELVVFPIFERTIF